VVAVGLALMMDADMSVRTGPKSSPPPIQGMEIVVVDALFWAAARLRRQARTSFEDIIERFDAGLLLCVDMVLDDVDFE